MDPNRRIVLQRSMAAGAAVFSLVSSDVVLARWTLSDFEQSNLASVLSEIAEDKPAIASESVVVDVPSVIQNPAILPVSVRVELPDVESIVLLVEDNREPFAGRFRFHRSVSPTITTRVKLEQSGRIVAMAQTPSGFFVNAAMVEIDPFVCHPKK